MNGPIEPHTSSPAAIPAGDEGTPPRQMLPPPPDAGTWVAIAMLGPPVAVAASLVGGSLALLWVERLPHSHWPTVVVILIAAVIPGISLRGWRRSLTSDRPLPGRWVALAMPFFIVVGAAMGIGVVQVAYEDAHRDPAFFATMICQRNGVYSGPVFDRCRPVAERCVREVLAADRFAVRADAVACVEAALSARPPTP